VLGQPEINFTLPYPPTVNKIWRPTGKGLVKTAAARKWQTDAGWAYKAAGGRRLDGPLMVLVNLSPPNDGRKRDVDNGLKALLDSLNGVAWGDDYQVVAVAAVRFPPLDAAGSAEVKIWRSRS